MLYQIWHLHLVDDDDDHHNLQVVPQHINRYPESSLFALYYLNFTTDSRRDTIVPMKATKCLSPTEPLVPSQWLRPTGTYIHVVFTSDATSVNYKDFLGDCKNP